MYLPTNNMTEAAIERIVESNTNKIDGHYLCGEITEKQYRAALATLNAWSKAQLARIECKADPMDDFNYVGSRHHY